MIEPANQILESALSAARRGDLDSAREHYRLLLEAQPDRPDGLLGLGSLELPWDDACMRFHETDRIVRTASYSQVKQPMYESSIGRHKNYDRWLQPLRDALPVTDD